MKSSFTVLGDIISVLEPGRNAENVEIYAIEDGTGTYHVAPELDLFEYVVHRVLSGSLPCEPKGESSPVAVSLLKTVPFCENCAVVPAALLHALVEPELAHAARVIYELQIFGYDPDPAQISAFVDQRGGKEILGLTSVLMTHEIGQRVRTDDIELPEDEKYAEKISSIIERYYLKLEELRSILGSGLAASKIRTHLATSGMDSEETGESLVVLSGLRVGVSDLMNDDLVKPTGETDTDTAAHASADQLTSARDALALQYLFAPDARDHSSAVRLPSWAAAAIEELNPSQLRSERFTRLTETEADTALRLHTFDPTSIYSDLAACVTAAMALNTEPAR